MFVTVHALQKGPQGKTQRAELGLTLLLGDAGLFYDQITGKGLSLAFVQAELVANTIENWDTIEGRAAFVNTVARVGKTYIQVTDCAMFFTRHALLRRLMVWVLARSPKLFAHFLHVNMGEYPLFKPPVKLVLQALLSPQQRQV